MAISLKGVVTSWRGNFLTGMAIVLPGAITLGILAWMFSTVTTLTDALLIFVPHKYTHRGPEGTGPMYWYWSLTALLIALVLITFVGHFARYYFGKKVIETADSLVMRVPLLNKIYTTIKQVNTAFSPNNKSAFKQVVQVEFPQPGQYAVGFVTGEQPQFGDKSGEKMISVFVPTTPNPTGGFMIILPESKVRKLDMTVAEGIKFIISLGAIAPTITRNGEQISE